MMAEKWKVQDSARTMTQKYNALVDEVNKTFEHKASTEKTDITIEDNLSYEEIDELLMTKKGV